MRLKEHLTVPNSEQINFTSELMMESWYLAVATMYLSTAWSYMILRGVSMRGKFLIE
jgi:hypothetical protein